VCACMHACVLLERLWIMHITSGHFIPSYCTSKCKVFNKLRRGSTMLGLALFTIGCNYWKKYISAYSHTHTHPYTYTHTQTCCLPEQLSVFALPSVELLVNYKAGAQWDLYRLVPQTWDYLELISVTNVEQILEFLRIVI